MSTTHLHIERTDTSPGVDLDEGLIEFVGRSLPLNSEVFYSRVYHWLDRHLSNDKGGTITVNMKLDYIDTSSSRHLYNIFRRLAPGEGDARQVQVNWHYEAGDEEMAETGKDYQRFFNFDFRFIEVDELF
jgi:hypothetical protein